MAELKIYKRHFDKATKINGHLASDTWTIAQALLEKGYKNFAVGTETIDFDTPKLLIIKLDSKSAEFALMAFTGYEREEARERLPITITVPDLAEVS